MFVLIIIASMSIAVSSYMDTNYQCVSSIFTNGGQIIDALLSKTECQERCNRAATPCLSFNYVAERKHCKIFYENPILKDDSVAQFILVDSVSSVCRDNDDNDCRRRPPSDCYYTSLLNSCCSTCKKYKTGPAGCEYGDREAYCASLTKADCKGNYINRCCCLCRTTPWKPYDTPAGDRKIWAAIPNGYYSKGGKYFPGATSLEACKVECEHSSSSCSGVDWSTNRKEKCVLHFGTSIIKDPKYEHCIKISSILTYPTKPTPATYPTNPTKPPPATYPTNPTKPPVATYPTNPTKPPPATYPTRTTPKKYKNRIN